MKRAVFGLAVGMCLGLCACAQTGGTRLNSATPSISEDIDMGKVIAVNQWALSRGATVVWINYPQKPKSSQDNNK